jgi:VWFA-related protein
MLKPNKLSFIVILFMLLLISGIGCSGGGGDGENSPPPSPSIQVLPSSYDFGSVTPGNSPAPLEVEIANNGSMALSVDNINLSDGTNFVLDLSKGSNPCFTASSTIAAGDNCTAEIIFNPGLGLNETFNTNLTIKSDDPDDPTLNIPLIGSREAISELNVKINQVETSCTSSVVTTYVSVTDQGGYPVITLTPNDFQITETDGYAGPPTSSPFVENNATLSVAVAIDYSDSISDIQDAVQDMEDSVISFVENLGDEDEAEIIDFGSTVEVALGFTNNIDDLTYAIDNPVIFGGHTALYDAIFKAVDDTALRSKDRKAVVVITDGVDDNGSGSQQSINSLNDAIDYASSKAIPVFPVGIGFEIDSAILQQIADKTSGQFYEALTSDNLRTIYQQLSVLLLQKQYILTYTSNLGPGPNTDLTIEATLPPVPPAPAVEGDDTKAIVTTCP